VDASAKSIQVCSTIIVQIAIIPFAVTVTMRLEVEAVMGDLQQSMTSLAYSTYEQVKIISRSFSTTSCFGRRMGISGSEVNCIDEAFAKKRNLTIDYGAPSHRFDLPIRGRQIRSIGQAFISCSFPEDPDRKKSRQYCFYVFESFKLCAVLLGRVFLRTTRTLDLYQHRFKEIKGNPQNPFVIKLVGNIDERVSCWLDGTPLSSIADTGAGINVMSPKFARRLGYHDDPGCKAIQKNETDRIFVEFADGSEARASGRINITIAFSEPSKSVTKVLTLVDSISGSKSFKTGTGTIGRNSSISEPFYIIQGLRHDVILGETLLATVDAYNQHARNFKTSSRSRDNTTSIAPIWEKKKKEGRKQTHPACSKEEQFKDNLDVQLDIYEKKMVDINKKQTKGELLHEQAEYERACAKHARDTWMWENKELMDQIFPGDYEKHVYETM